MNEASYICLLTAYPPRPIRTEEELTQTQLVIDALLDKGYDQELSQNEKDYVIVLGLTVSDYEQKHYAIN